MINEKSVSETQQRLMGQAYAVRLFIDSKGKEGLDPKDIKSQYRETIISLAKKMTKKQLVDFAATKHKDLPEKVEEGYGVKIQKTIPDITPVLKPESNKPGKKSKFAKLQNLIDYREFISSLKK